MTGVKVIPKNISVIISEELLNLIFTKSNTAKDHKRKSSTK